MGILKIIRNLFSVGIISLLSCKDEILNLERLNQNTNIIRFDGYFYNFSERITDDIKGSKLYDSFVIYQNGIYFSVGQGSYLPSDNINLRFKETDESVLYRVKNIKDFSKHRLGWGVFKVIGSEIEIERWVTSSSAGPYPTEILKGQILNDTTINFHTKLAAEPLVAKGKKKTFSINETYHFRKFSPKPDSTNK